MCNGSGIIRHMEFCDSFVEDNTDSLDPEEAKYSSDLKIFKPALDHFFEYHPSSNLQYIIGDSGFDSDSNNNHAYYQHSLIPLISLNPRNSGLSRPRTNCKCGYIHYEKPSEDIRSHPIIPRYSDQWDEISGSRHIIEQVISRLKLPPRMGGSILEIPKSLKLISLCVVLPI